MKYAFSKDMVLALKMHVFIFIFFKLQSSTKDDKNEKKSSDTKSIDDASETDAKKRGKITTKDPFLLLSYCFFDKTHCGFIFDKDVESLIFSLGLHLSRHQVREKAFVFFL